ncbi:hypothetical protein [Hydrogenophaga sp.]|uniref:hypothetical protein n=1 Tax=Hydrogenophaga sp. TaxID=1904254 RepID=UPI00272FDE31|nr:hypothetical protein [Hydrogenophaga sp.]MDP1686862.1 hypothetical protein [Hydrogenophaga sp.]
MSIAKPGAASTITPAALQPSFIGSKCLIWVENTIDLGNSAALLYRKYGQLKSSPLRSAIWDGYWELKTETNRCVEEAKRRGLLLLCWEGTTARRISAAAPLQCAARADQECMASGACAEAGACVRSKAAGSAS